ncbi:MAG: riboflavin synthase [Gemmatimonadales bacterium]|nr:MAG: riboflavin synthase [Gemmatimonadales bacterium]
MFTGIIETMGRISGVQDRDGIREFALQVPESFAAGIRPGDSVAVDGACLTPVRVDPGLLHVQVIGTTLGRTVAGRYKEGSSVNLERAMAMGGRLDGHLVQGHVDGTGELVSVTEDGEYWRLRFRVPPEVHRGTIPHGSIALNGISLTVNALLEPDQVEVGIIPHTWTHTNLSELEPGDPVNVEGDLIGKYVGRWLETRPEGTDPAAGAPRPPDDEGTD